MSTAIEQQVATFQEQFKRVKEEVSKVIVGYGEIIDGVIMSLLAGGHPDFRDIERREAGVLEAYVVPSRHQIDRTVVTRVISLGGRSDVRLTRSNSDLDARYGCATRIRHRAFDHATVDLRVKQRRTDGCPHEP